MATMAEDQPTPAALERALAQVGSAAAEGEGLTDGDRLAEQVSAMFGADALRAGPIPSSTN